MSADPKRLGSPQGMSPARAGAGLPAQAASGKASLAHLLQPTQASASGPVDWYTGADQLAHLRGSLQISTDNGFQPATPHDFWNAFRDLALTPLRPPAPPPSILLLTSAQLTFRRAAVEALSALLTAQADIPSHRRIVEGDLTQIVTTVAALLNPGENIPVTRTAEKSPHYNIQTWRHKPHTLIGGSHALLTAIQTQYEQYTADMSWVMSVEELFGLADLVVTGQAPFAQLRPDVQTNRALRILCGISRVEKVPTDDRRELKDIPLPRTLRLPQPISAERLTALKELVITQLHRQHELVDSPIQYSSSRGNALLVWTIDNLRYTVKIQQGSSATDSHAVDAADTAGRWEITPEPAYDKKTGMQPISTQQLTTVLNIARVLTALKVPVAINNIRKLIGEVYLHEVAAATDGIGIDVSTPQPTATALPSTTALAVTRDPWDV